MASADDNNLNSMEHVRPSQLYSLRPLVKDDDKLVVPFPELCGEGVTYLGHTKEGTIALSTFRLFIRCRDAVVNIPLGLIEQIDARDIFDLLIYCKDARTYRCTFATNEACVEWSKRLSAALQPQTDLKDLFAFAFYAWCHDTFGQPDSGIDALPGCHQLWTDVSAGSYTFDGEVNRLGFKLKKDAWRITYINEDYKLCKSYPRLHIVPHVITDDHLKKVAEFRACHRFPSVVWRDVTTGAVLVRCSQPEIGWLGWRSTEDEILLKAISAACVEEGPPEGRDDKASPTRMLIVDARSYAAAVANRAKGGGCECPEYYPNCEIQFMNLANIHTIRKSFQALRALCAQAPDTPGWLTAVENTKWLHHISGLLRSAVNIVNALKDARPVLVHCSDGWDRTPQLVTLAQLMVDPYYRTLQGFRVLIEREWLEFGHKFADRCGHGRCGEDVNERCPVFLQWLDCVHQLLLQFPCNFQFNEAWLVKLVQHTYSCLFGTFLCNTDSERSEFCVKTETCSLWSLLEADSTKFTNCLYKAGSQTLLPVCHMKCISLWSSVYTSDTYISEELASEELKSLEATEALLEAPLIKTRSCDDIKSEVELCGSGAPMRRLSDPNISREVDFGLLHQAGEEESSGHGSLEVEEDQSSGSPTSEGFEDARSDTSGVNGVVSEASDVTLINDSNEDGGEENVGTEAGGDGDGEESGQETPSDMLKSDCDKKTQDEGRSSNEESHFLRTRPFESSTDTLTEEIGIQSCVTLPPACNGLDSSRGDQMPSKNENNAQETSTLDSDSPTALVSPPTHIDRLSERSTSTSDLTDSRVTLGVNCSQGINSCASNVTRKLKRELEKLRTSETLSSLEVMVDTVDGGSVTSSSSSPPTPASDSTKGWTTRYLHRHLDLDGLTTHQDPVQQRLAQLERDHKQQVQRLQHQLVQQKQLLQQYHNRAIAAAESAASASCRHHDDEMLSLESSESSGGEQGSIGASSDASWETVEPRDARITMWMPDHAVTHCASCGQQFMLLCRKHHCRNCGQVFCGECSNEYLPIPHQQLNNPVRVCTRCYQAIRAGMAPAATSHSFADTPQECDSLQ